MSSLDLADLHCYGCAHSAVTVDFPGMPSDELPCGFCIRNPLLDRRLAALSDRRWADGSTPLRVPMDCYHSLDFQNQVELWVRQAGPDARSEAIAGLLQLAHELEERV